MTQYLLYEINGDHFTCYTVDSDYNVWSFQRNVGKQCPLLEQAQQSPALQYVFLLSSNAM